MAKKQNTFMEQIEDKFPHLLIKDDEEHELTAIHTGSISLDFSTGIGGIPRTRFTEIYGPESSGKTTLCLSIAKSIIQAGGKVLYIDAENGLDYDYVNAIIGDYGSEQFVLLQPSYAEETFMLAEEGIKSEQFDLIVLDSIAVLASKKEAEKEFEDFSVAEMSRLISKFIKRNTYEIRHSNIAFIFVNQVRDKIGSYVPVLEAPGGHAIKHICSLRIQLTAGMAKDDKIMEDGEIVGIYIRFLIKKNKVGKPFRVFSFPIIFGKGIDYMRDLVPFAETLGILVRAGSYYKYEDVTIGQGLLNTIEYLNSNPETLDKIEKELYNTMYKVMTPDEKGEQDEQELAY